MHGSEAVGNLKVSTAAWAAVFESARDSGLHLRRSSKARALRRLAYVGAIGLAFVVAVLHVYALKAADGLGEAWDQKKTSLPYTLHRFFTRHLPQEEKPPAGEAHLVASNASPIGNP